MKLERKLSFWDVFCIASGAMISSGIFILPGIAFSKTGPSIFASYFIGGLIALLGICALIEMATAMPKAGGDYFFITRSLGPLIGTVSGVLSWLAISFKTGFAIFGLSEVIYLLTNFNILAIGIVVTIFFAGINILGIKIASTFDVLLVIILFLVMFIYIFLGFPNINLNHFESFVPHGTNAIFSTAAFVFVSFGGLLKISSIAEEISNPKKNIPLGLLAALIVTTLLYTAVTFILVGIMPTASLSKSLTPIADSAKLLYGTPGFAIITFSAVLAFITTIIAGIMSASRYPFALSRDNLFPAFIGKISKRFKTPVVAISITAALIIFSLFLGLEHIVKAASTIMMTTYILSNIAVIILRESKVHNYRPSFKTPFYPWLPLISIIIFTTLIIELGYESIEISLFFIFLSIAIYFLYGTKKANITYALLHLIERITNKELTNTFLESELRDILRHRDNLQIDHFDKIVKKAYVLDIDEHINSKELVRQLIGDTCLMGYNQLQINQREIKASAISPFVAVPHIIIDGEKKFNIIIVRCKKGIAFSKEYKSIKAVFFLIGTKDEKTIQLQSLTAIAQIIHDKKFQERWLQAKEIHNLKDMLLLSKRRRLL
jgi:basic amino acid/polyamine antiporter, APA family